MSVSKSLRSCIRSDPQPQTTVRIRRHGKSYNWLWLSVVLLSLFSITSAYDMTAEDVSNTGFYKKLERQGKLVIDTRPPPQVLVRRQDDTNSTSTSDSSPTSTSQTVSQTAMQTASQTIRQNTTQTTTSSPSSTSSDSVATSTGLPTPFDTSLGNNFTTPACPVFFQSFLNNATFQSCLPISLLLQNSMSFFKTARSQVLLDQTLDTSCGASLALCSPLMKHFADALISTQNCGDDYERQNPLVAQAYAGLTAYEPMYKATCLKDQTNNKYCFSEAMTNSSNSSDSYPYYTGVGIDLPAKAAPSCTQCLHDTMQIFAGYAVQKSQPLSSTYLNCAFQVNKGCGNSFANVEVQAGSTGTSANEGGKTRSGMTMLLTISIALMFSLI